MELIGEHAEAIIALCALFLTVYQLVATRRHNIISVRPFLAEMSHKDRTKNDANVEYKLRWEIANKGLGPAIICDHTVLLDGKACEPNAALKLVLEGLKHDSSVMSLAKGYAIAANEAKTIFQIRFVSTDPDLMDKYEAKLARLDVVIHYKSAYGEKFTLNTSESG